MAVEVLRKASCFEEALHLSKKHGLYASYLRMQIEDLSELSGGSRVHSAITWRISVKCLAVVWKRFNYTPNRGNDVVFDRFMYTEF